MSNRILIAEDDTAIARLIAMNLKAAGMDPVVFENGAEAAASLSADHRYDLAILDIMMPDKDGFSLFQDIKPYGIPVIFLTAKDDLDAKITGLQNGAEDYIVKPFEMLELLVRMEKVINRTKKPAYLWADGAFGRTPRSARRTGNPLEADGIRTACRIGKA